MRLHYFLATLLAALPTSLADTITASGQCTTAYGPSPVSEVPTTTQIRTRIMTFTEEVIYTPTTTIIPDATITTAVITEYSESTLYQTSTPSSTVLAPSAFIPFNSTFDDNPSKKRRDADTSQENDTGAAAFVQNIALIDQNGLPIHYPKHYPTAVACRAVVKISTTTTTTYSVLTVATVTAAQPTETAFSTTTCTTTKTVTYYAPAVTYYDACNSNNRIASYSGNGFPQLIYTPALPGDRILQLTTKTSYDCCVACQNTLNCAGSVWTRGMNTCELDLGTSCEEGSGTVRIGDIYSANFTDPGKGYWVSNGPCGRYGYGGLLGGS